MQILVIAVLKNNKKNFFLNSYTLIEIIAVIMILTLILGMAMTALRSSPVFLTVNALANEIRQLCSDAKQSATTKGENVTIYFDPENNSISFQDVSINIADSIKLYIDDRDLSQFQEKEKLFLFYPDGTGAEKKTYY